MPFKKHIGAARSEKLFKQTGIVTSTGAPKPVKKKIEKTGDSSNRDKLNRVEIEKKKGQVGKMHFGKMHDDPAKGIKAMLHGHQMDKKIAALSGAKVKPLRNVGQMKEASEEIHYFASLTTTLGTLAMTITFLSHFLFDGFSFMDMTKVARDGETAIVQFLMDKFMEMFYPRHATTTSALSAHIRLLDQDPKFWQAFVKAFGTFMVPRGRRNVNHVILVLHRVPMAQLQPSGESFLRKMFKDKRIPEPQSVYSYMPITVVRSNRLAGECVLNGNNGSWTGSDDVNSSGESINKPRQCQTPQTLPWFTGSPMEHDDFEIYSFEARVPMDVEPINLKRKRDCFESVSKTLWLPLQKHRKVYHEGYLSGDYIDSTGTPSWIQPRKYHSVLNGNNGSWTGSDDVETALSDKLQRARRQYYNRVNNRRPMDENLRAADGDMELRVAGKPKIRAEVPKNFAYYRALASQNDKDDSDSDLPDLDHDSDDESEDELEVRCNPVDLTGEFLVKGANNVGWDGKHCYHFNGDFFTSREGVIKRSIDEGVHLQHCIKVGTGFFTVSDDETKGTPIITSPCCALIYLPEYCHLGESHNAEHYDVFWPLLKVLESKFPTNAVKNHTRQAAHAAGEREFLNVGLPPGLLNSTVRYFCANKTHMLTEQLKNTPSYAPPDCENENAYYCHSVGVTVDHCGVFKQVSVSCDIPSNYDVNGIFSVSIKGGVCLVDRHLGVLNEETLVRPVFDTPENLTPKFYHTRMFRLVGTGTEPFLLYDVNGANAGKALKRCLAKRDHEALFTQCQYRFGHALALGSSPDILTAMRVRCGADYVRVGHGNDYHNVPISDDNNMLHELEIICPSIPRNILERQYSHSPQQMIGYTQDLTDCHKRDLLRHTIDKLLTTKNWLFYVGYDAYLTHLEPILFRQNLADMPHVKKQLRIAYINGAQIHDTDELLVSELSGQVKKELAKFGKVPRLFVSYGAGSMYAGHLPEYSKLAIDGHHFHQIGELFVDIYIIGKPRSDMFDAAFQTIRDAVTSTNYLFVVLYSDDSVYAGNINGVPFMLNVDISSCDAGQRWPIFLAVHNGMAQTCPMLSRGLIKQCTLPLKVKNPSNPSESLTIKFDGPYEGSGTVLTTLLNHYGSYLIARNAASSLSLCLPNITEIDTITDCIRLGAACAGHKITIEDCEGCFEKVQLLKHSMMLTEDGRWTYGINYGTIMRGLGSVEGDMTHDQLGMNYSQFKTTNWSERLDRFTGVVIQGLKHEPSSVIMDALRERFCNVIDESAATRGQRELLRKHGLYDQDGEPVRSSLYVTDESLCARYGCTVDDLHNLANTIKGIKLGMDYIDPAVATFFQVDYGAPVIV